MSDPTPRRGSNMPLILILAVAGLIVLGAIGYVAMAMSGPMPGMGH